MDKEKPSLVNPPKNIPFYLRFMTWIADKKAGRKMLPGRLLAWSPSIGISSGILELYVEKGAAKILDGRLIKMIRMYISFAIPCSFAIDINSWNYKNFRITKEEIEALQGKRTLNSVNSFSEQERVGLKYALALTKTPVVFEENLLTNLHKFYTEKEIVAIAALSAKVNYWTRLLEALRLKPAGYTNDPLLELDKYDTFKPIIQKNKGTNKTP